MSRDDRRTPEDSEALTNEALTDEPLRQSFLPAAYARLRAIAAGQRRALPVETLNTTALVNEGFLRMVSAGGGLDREHYYALFATVVRNALIDHIRNRQAQKRDAPEVSLIEAAQVALDTGNMERLMAIDEALTRMRVRHARLVQVVEMRFFAGFENQEIAEILGVTEKTVRRDWLQARAMLAEFLDDE
ncbi:RNA polymerase subunit sigma [Ahniella affigens]|uniref:RNA polymerase subunit sigma n=1 Tax=Ahniella affigens TaxID=2021234 RepID=A0A2P1PUQ5_9GAMM|nr:ECF-type sigma factor [Ahniella affigens]AVP98550.1 RNA polymerase subunit sigma [Ahniella affigens]